MTRPQDWTPLAAVDPVPGDADAVSAEARRLGAVADEINDQIEQLRRIGVAEGLEGEYVKTLTTGATALADRLSRILIRYRAVSGALGIYAPELERAQAASRRILTRAQLAEQDRRTQERLLAFVESPAGPAAAPGAAPASPETAAEADRHRRAMAAATEEVERARADLRRVEGERDRAAEAAAQRIRSGSDDSVKDGWWDNVKDWVHRNSGWIATVTKVLGCVGAALVVVSLFIPGLNVVTAVALAVSAGALAGHTALAASGDGSWTDVGLDAVALATLGLGRLATVALRSARGPARTGGPLARVTGRGPGGGRAAQLQAMKARARDYEHRMRTAAMEEYVNAPLRGPVIPTDRLLRGSTDPGLAARVADGRAAAAVTSPSKVLTTAARITGSDHQTARAAYGAAAGAEALATGREFDERTKRQDRWTMQVGSAW